MNRTALHPEHLKLGAKMTDFNGWDMPLYYTSILEEHAAVRRTAGLFDISHMGQVWVSGASAMQSVNELVVSDVAQVGEGRACYTMLTNERGGILDDIIVYRVGAQEWLVIVNCANRAKDLEWLTRHRRPGTEVRDLSQGRAILAIQGPKSAEALERALELKLSGMGRFDVIPAAPLGRQAWVARTGYTGSDGFELFLPDAQAVRAWQRLIEQRQAPLERTTSLTGQASGVMPVGLGARDTLRLEAGLRLYGTDMDEATTPLEADLGWTVALHKASFLGKEALVRQHAAGVSRRLAGFEMSQGPVPRHGCALWAGTPAAGGTSRQVGQVTSGTFSPVLGKPIGMGYVEAALAKPGTALEVDIRLKRHPATVVKMPFWRKTNGDPSGVTLHQVA
ncbi:MAG: glycine cleavage system aminomethyltransferase GcvT [Candidatus Omnitrophica bacterium]|nr:glycine cleavage system aminomethyltransferase GcvT [Candidatus Omnitrophota bacterium]